MTVNGPSPPINLETGNWSPPPRWMGRVRGWRLLKWILWDPYALRAYVRSYIQEVSVRAGLSPWRVRVFFLSDVISLIMGVWLALALFFILVSMWWLSPTSLLLNTLYSLLLCAATSIFILTILGLDLDDLATAAIWSFVAGIGVAVLYWVEMSFREAPPELGLLLYFAFVVIFGSLMGVLLNSILHGMARRRASRGSMSVVKGLLIFFYVVGLLFYIGMLTNRILHHWIPFTISFWPLFFGLILSLVIVYLSCRRVDDWFWGIRSPSTPPSDGPWSIPRVTPVPPRPVQTNLKQWINDDWDSGLPNVNQIWRYTNMDGATRRRMVTYLDGVGDNDVVVRAISSLEDRRFDWRLTDLFPEIGVTNFPWRSLFSKDFWLRTSPVDSSNPYIPYAQNFAAINVGPRRVRNKGIKSKAARIAVGFAQMERWQFRSAAKNFEGVRGSELAAELAQLALTLDELSQVENRLEQFPYPLLPEPPATQSRGAAWTVIRRLDEGLFYLWLRRRTLETGAQSELVSAARDQFDEVDRVDLLEPEASLLEAMVERWRAELNVLVGSEVIDSPQVPNPYRADRMKSNDPAHVDRDERTIIQDALLYSPDSSILVLTGLPGIGISMLLADLDPRLSVVRVSLTRIAEGANAGDNLVRLLVGEIAQQTNQRAPVNFPADGWRQTLQDYIFDVIDSPGSRLTIAIDDLERTAGMPIGRSSMGRVIEFIAKSLTGEIEGLSLILAGHFTPRETSMLGGDQAVSLAFFDEEEIGILLADPVWGSVLYYQQQALKRIQDQTGGHPTLVRLLGAALVDRYNRSNPRYPVFSVEDVDAVVQNRIFQSRIERMVFRSMMAMVQRIGGQADVLLGEIARYPNTRTDGDLASLMARQYGTSSDQVRRTLRDLSELDLITRGEPRNGQETWRMTIPLFQEYLRNR